jgi:hypothetical protein
VLRAYSERPVFSVVSTARWQTAATFYASINPLHRLSAGHRAIWLEMIRGLRAIGLGPGQARF